jgi:hypothetical protein
VVLVELQMELVDMVVMALHQEVLVKVAVRMVKTELTLLVVEAVLVMEHQDLFQLVLVETEQLVC